MASNWRTVKLRDICSNIYSGGTPDTRIDAYWNGNIPWLSSGETGNRYIYDTVKKITRAGVENSSTRLAHIGDIAIASAGQGYTRGQAAYLLIDTYVNQSLVVLESNNKVVDSRFLFFNVASRYSQLRDISDSHSSRGSLTTKLLADLDIALPPLSEQRAIAQVLGSLDDKIELNRRMGRTLESIVQAVFREWFVNSEEARGWETRNLGDICEFAYGKGLKEEQRQRGFFPVYGSGGQIGWHNEYLIKGPGIIVGRKGNPGIVTWSQNDFFPIDTAFYVIEKDSNINLYWLYYTLISLNLPGLGADSAVPGLNRNIAYKSTINYPSPNLMNQFEDFTKPLFNKLYANDKESLTLTELRDTLLPKLMRGEVRVKDVEGVL